MASKLKRFITIFFFTLALPIGIFCQDSPTPNIPDAAMKQVVSRILRWYFKPAAKLRKIHLANDGISLISLPEIKNVEFELVSLDELPNETKAYFFRPAKSDGNHFSIDFGYGDPDCDAAGDTWSFRFRETNVRLWRSGRGWGSGCCGGTGPPKIGDLEIGDVSPNELKGYEFFRSGKLKGIKLGVSTREEIKRILGDTCEGACDYDENWNLWVNYYDEKTEGSETKYPDDGKPQKKTLIVRPQYVGRLRFAHLTPKHNISFAKVIFSRKFAENKSYHIGDSFSDTGEFQGAVHWTVTTFTDGYGLTYEIFDEITFHNIPVTWQSNKGDLEGIEYATPDELESGIFMEKNL